MEAQEMQTVDSLIAEAALFPSHGTTLRVKVGQLTLCHRGKAERHRPVDGGWMVEYESTVWTEVGGSTLCVVRLPYGEDDVDELRQAVEMALAGGELRLSEDRQEKAGSRAWILRAIAADVERCAPLMAPMRTAEALLVEAIRRGEAPEKLRQLILDALPPEPRWHAGWEEAKADRMIQTAIAAPASYDPYWVLGEEWGAKVAPVLRSVKMVEEAHAALAAAQEERDAAIRHARSVGVKPASLVEGTGLSRPRIYEIFQGER